MRASGDYVQLTVNGNPYGKKPPVLMWLQVGISRITGGIDEVEARLPSALAGVGSVLLTALLGAILFGRRAGFWAALFLAVTPYFVQEGRMARMDVLVTFLTLLSWLGFVLWERGAPGVLTFLLFFLPFPIGILTKWTGPLFVVPPVAAFLLIMGAKRRVPWGWVVVGAALTVAPLLVWMDVTEFGKILGGASHRRPWHFHPGRLVAVTMPFFLLIPGAVAMVRTRRPGPAERRGLALLLLWVVVDVVVLSFAKAKRTNYLDPLIPAVMLAAGWFVARVLDEAPSALRRWGLGWPIGALAGVVLLGGVVLVARPDLIAGRDPYYMTEGVVRGGATGAAVLGLALLICVWRAPPAAAVAGLVAAMAVGAAAWFIGAAPMGNPAQSVRPFMSVYRDRAGPEARISYLGADKDSARWAGPELNFYGRTRIGLLITAEQALDFLGEKGERFVIFRPDRYEEFLALCRGELPTGLRLEAENRYDGNEYVLVSNRRGPGPPLLLAPPEKTAHTVPDPESSVFPGSEK